jgi:hypothetical protein
MEYALVNITIRCMAPQRGSLELTCGHEASALRLTREWEHCQRLETSSTSRITQMLESFDESLSNKLSWQKRFKYKVRGMFHSAWKRLASDDMKYGSTALNENNIPASETNG